MLKTHLAVWALATAILAATATLTAGCGTEPVPDTPSFAVDVAPIMHARCVRCHGGGGTLNIDPTYDGGHPALAWLDAVAIYMRSAAEQNERRGRRRSGFRHAQDFLGRDSRLFECRLAVHQLRRPIGRLLAEQFRETRPEQRRPSRAGG